MTLDRPCVFKPVFQTCLSPTNVCERTVVVKWRICVAAKSFVRAKFGKWRVLKCSYSCNQLVPANSLTMPRIILCPTLNQKHRTVLEIVHIFYKSKQAKLSPPFSFRIFLDKRFWKTPKTQFQLRRMMLDVVSISKGKRVSGSRITSPKGYFLCEWLRISNWNNLFFKKDDIL